MTQQVFSRFCGYLLTAWEWGQKLSGLFPFILNQNFSFSAKSAPLAQFLHCYCGFRKLSTLILYFKRKEFPCVTTIYFRKTRNEQAITGALQCASSPWATVNNHSGEAKMILATHLPILKYKISYRMPTGLSKEKWCGFHICISSSPLERVASSSVN